MTLAPATPLADVLARITEKDHQRQVVQVARTLGWKVFHPFDSRRSAHGWPDLSLLRERLVVVELKTERGKLTGPQREWLRDLLDAGVETYLARPRHLQALASVLAHRGRPWDARGPIVDTAAELRDELRKEVA